MMDVNGIGAESYYFNKLWCYWSDKCTNGEITESQMENKIDKIESMTTRQRKVAFDKLVRGGEIDGEQRSM